MSSQILWKSAAVCGRGAWLMLPQRGCSVSASLLQIRKSQRRSALRHGSRGKEAWWSWCSVSNLFQQWTDRLSRQAGALECISQFDFWEQDSASAPVTCGTAFCSPCSKEQRRGFLLGFFFSNQRTWLIVNLLGTEQELYLAYILLLP